jgi:DNA-binding NarL/FixJ family response regulator
MTRVVLADNQVMLRQSLASALQSRGFDVVGQASDPEATVRTVVELKPDLLIFDLRMCPLESGPDGVSGVELCRKLANRTRILVLTMERESSVLSGAFRAGATGYLLKTASLDDLTLAARRATNGETVVSRDLKPVLLAEVNAARNEKRTAPKKANEARVISRREGEVLQLIADGCSTPEVAEQLYISQKTVKNHLASIYQKLEARDRTQAVLRAVRMGLVSLD